MKQLLTSIFSGGNTQNSEEETMSEKNNKDNVDNKINSEVTSSSKDINSTAIKYNGWKLVCHYHHNNNSIEIFHISSKPTDDIVESDKNRDSFKSIIANVHCQLNSIDDEGFINIDNSMVIRKNQLINICLYTVSE